MELTFRATPDWRCSIRWFKLVGYLFDHRILLFLSINAWFLGKGNNDNWLALSLNMGVFFRFTKLFINFFFFFFWDSYLSIWSKVKCTRTIVYRDGHYLKIKTGLGLFFISLSKCIAALIFQYWTIITLRVCPEEKVNNICT